MNRLRALSDRLESSRVRPVLLIALVLFLIGGSAVAFAMAERLKLERSPVQKPHVQRRVGPTCECPKAVARLSFTLPRADRVTASIIDRRGRRVRFVARDEPQKAGTVAFVWDGRTGDGEVARDGRYRWRIAFGQAHRTVTIPTPVRVDTKPPDVRLISATPHLFSPDGDGRADRVLYRYRSSESGDVFVNVDGIRAQRAIRPAGVTQTRWNGNLEGEIAKAGVTYTTWLVVVDSAGNESRPTRSVDVRVRYVRLVRAPKRIPRGGLLTFRIDADAERVSWSFRGITRGGNGIHGTGAPGVVRVRLPAGIQRGIYVLEATVPAGTDRTTVRVTQ